MISKRSIAAFFIIAVEINMMVVSIVFVTNHYRLAPGPFVGSVLGWSVALIGVGLFAKSALRSKIVFFFPFLCIMASLVCALLFNNTFIILTGKDARNVSVAEFDSYREATVIGFRDGKLRTDLTGEFVDRSFSNISKTSRGSTSTTYYAMPYVPGTWKESDPVRVWVTCTTSTEACRNNTRLAVVQDTFPGGVKEAEKKYGLKSDPAALAITWIESTEKEVREGKVVAAVGLAAINTAWIIIYSVLLIRISRENGGRRE